MATAITPVVPHGRAWQLGRWLLLLGWLLAAAGASYAPWVERGPAALALTAPDLAEFVKFLPEVRHGTLGAQRLLFLAPLFSVAFATSPIASSEHLACPGWLRAVLLAAVVPLALTLLPPVWSPSVLMANEFRLQTAGCVACLFLVVVSPWLRRLPLRTIVVPLAPLSLASPAIGLWQFGRVQGAVAAAYAGMIVPGWGAWAALIGGGLISLGLLLAWRGQAR
jgi:hypothetical protein